MTQRIAATDGTGLHVTVDGNGPPILMANSLGTDVRLWDGIIPSLEGYRVIRWDKRGHGNSEVPPPPYKMGTLVSDAEAVLDALSIKAAVVVGCSIGGMIAQGLAVKRPDQVRAVVLSNTAVKMGTAQMWQERIDAVQAGGMEAVVDAVLDRWFAPRFPDRALWRQRLLETPAEGYAGCCAALAGADLLTPTSGLRLPALCVAGDRDGASPPDMVRELADLIPGSRFHLIRGSGHLPMVDAPDAFANALTDFLTAIGH
ncbi:3-oxoadipate enol-lactonase [Jannaschia aquimarina]|uniref:CatD_2 protein n=1 Tax=Jannaschia aquimarina TaxID=935700 RepID=A0A0D1D690_9RHOB|nr:3-oxoadipate enol-lactonase [Jannaschia aquimarina]KIT15518.1 3-oxoadipate enol-lactonase 2 [Jannaschia aquimarina]SNT34423.1 3-oxoadipate enol-lactonase [Jannaschia aquimarina]